MCGAVLGESADEPAASASKGKVPEGRHHYHHHYHHHYLAPGMDAALLTGAIAPKAAPASNLPKDPRLRAPIGGPGVSRAEATLRQMTQDWALACNNKQLDDLLVFYATDALVLRPNLPPVRGTSAIREFFFSALDAGLGDIEMHALRVELVGDIAYEVGRCKMLVPTASGKRREERGKYVVLFAKQQNGEWKAVVDTWSTDLNLGLAADSVAAKAPPPGPLVPPKPRR
jgi:ketosteroid isomerase-like protein